jgi:mannosyl-3-phosphoglycerate phosphatase
MYDKRELLKNENLIIFTDLDGTLLDSTCSFEKALSALKLIQDRKIPLILCSSKTRTEIEHCRKKVKNDYPFISENGGGIFVPKSSNLEIQNIKNIIVEEKEYFIIKLGAEYADLRNALQELRSEGFDVKGFGDMSAGEIAELTGLTMTDAGMAKQRDFDEPFIFKGDEASTGKLKMHIKAKGLNLTRGDFFHIMGDSDKGRAVDILKKYYEKKYGRITTAALGDSDNDIEMLGRVDIPIAIKKKDGSFNQQIIEKVKGCVMADGIGPEGWNRAVIELLSTL